MAKRSKMYGEANERALNDSIFPPLLFSGGVFFERVPKRYGENPHQAACMYVPTNKNEENLEAVNLGEVVYGHKIRPLVVGGAKELKTGKAGLSVTNTRDIDRATRILKYFREDSACAVMKHINPSGVAVSTILNPKTLAECFRYAWEGDPVAAFGSVVVFTEPVDRDTANLIQDNNHYVEVVAAPGYEHGVVGIFENTVIKRDDKEDRKVNPRLRVVEFPNIHELPRYIEDGYDRLEIIQNDDGSFMLQEPYLTKIKGPDDVEFVTARKPTGFEWDDMLFSWHVCQAVRSNAVVIGKDGRILAAGTGKQSRLEAIDDALQKAKKYYDEHPDWLASSSLHDLNGAVLASDGFMPFADNIEPLLREGISAVIQPGGSTRDKKVIEACGKKIAMAYTNERCFIH